MQTLQNANTFFLITTIAVVVLILILLIIFISLLRTYSFVNKLINKSNKFIEEVEPTEYSKLFSKSLPFIMPVVGYLFSKNKKHKTNTHKR